MNKKWELVKLKNERMEGCQKDQRKVPNKLLQTTLNNIQEKIPNTNAIYVVGLGGKNATYIGSIIKVQKKKEKRRKSSSRESVSFEEVLSSLSQLILATSAVGKKYEDTDVIKTMHLQGVDSMITIVMNQRQNYVVVFDSDITEQRYDFDDTLFTICLPIFDSLQRNPSQ
ncbi:hypothetical protein EIN_381600 [Entamoeba invadens IP1]|uniref:Uncharacterized protein n=1 Tax=Entamoeba invadens IP1 TaxID=370355 RepID=A0A0A1UAT9_ENTIV|nr:hypothetical protein EIN_381600 [Entamoeba invadens IP1]ELP92193.1 hypothetical protein EIN_381600 [Entamoeba invadens IP1]|eukprot:XP_004258964.1 hypothetical protein EIN_381600 [Entamoeba invadens IP1]